MGSKIEYSELRELVDALLEIVYAPDLETMLPLELLQAADDTREWLEDNNDDEEE